MGYIICPPGAARGAEAQRPCIKSKSAAQRHNYGRLWRTQRRDNARPGDVLGAMERVLGPQCLPHPRVEAAAA